MLPRSLSSEEAIVALIRANGNIALCAERLHTTREFVLAAIANDPSNVDVLANAIRTTVLLNTFEMATNMHRIVTEVMADLEPSEIRKLYTGTVDLLTKLTDNKTTTQNVNITEVVMKQLPPEIRKAVLELVENEGE